MSCSSPRASTGFKMLAASIAPSAAPAPTMVWNSSTKRMALPSRTSSSSRFLNRSSKSPRYFVPATRLAMSRASRRRPWSIRGTCLSAMRWASPSASAVLPTPGSPQGRGCSSGGGIRSLPSGPALFPAEHRVQLAVRRPAGQIAAVFVAGPAAPRQRRRRARLDRQDELP